MEVLIQLFLGRHAREDEKGPWREQGRRVLTRGLYGENGKEYGSYYIVMVYILEF